MDGTRTFLMWGRGHLPRVLGGCAALAVAQMRFPGSSILQSVVFAELIWYAYMCAERKRFDPPSVTPNLDYKERQRVWRNCLQAVPDVSTFMRGWFDRAPLETITLNDCKRWLAWGFWGKHLEDMEQQDMVQVHEMVADLERDHNLKFSEKGCGQNARLLAFDREPFSSRHYPLLLYALTHGVVGSATTWLLRSRGFERQHAKGLSYWVRPGSSADTTLTPIVFVHGIGIGLLPYLGIIDGLIETGAPVVLSDLPFISLKVCTQVPDRHQTVASMRQVLQNNGMDRAMFVGHSFGTAICTWMVKHAPDMVVSVALLDPIVMLLNMSHCLHSFIYRRKDLSFIEELLRKDTFICHTLRRRFWWYEAILFVQDLQIPSLIVTSEHDSNMPVKEIHYHIDKELATNACRFPPRVIDIKEQGHGGFLSCESTRQMVVDEIASVWKESLSPKQMKKSLSRADTVEMEHEMDGQ